MRYYLKYDRAPAELKTEVCKPFEDRDFEAQRMKLEDLEYGEISDMITKNKDLNFGLFHEFLDHFQFLGGFDILTKALESIVAKQINMNR